MIDQKNAYVGVMVALVCLTGCASTPKYMSESFDVQQVDRLIILPFMDNRAEPDPEHDFEFMCNRALDMILSNLKSKGYHVLQSGDVGAVSSYSVQDLPRPAPDSKDTDSVDPGSVDAEWIKNLGPSSDRWVFVPVFDELSTKFLVIGFRADAKISGYLFDKELGELSWKHVGKGTDRIGILGAPFYNAIAGRQGLQKGAVETASIICVHSFPKR